MNGFDGPHSRGRYSSSRAPGFDLIDILSIWIHSQTRKKVLATTCVCGLLTGCSKGLGVTIQKGMALAPWRQTLTKKGRKLWDDTKILPLSFSIRKSWNPVCSLHLQHISAHTGNISCAQEPRVASDNSMGHWHPECLACTSSFAPDLTWVLWKTEPIPGQWEWGRRMFLTPGA